MSFGVPPGYPSSVLGIPTRISNLVDGQVLEYRSALNAWVNVTPAAPGPGVSSLNSLTGDLSIVAGSGITVTPAGSSITIAATGGGGAVSSVSNSDGTLTISPTTGSVVASLNLGNANTWTATQTFPSASLTNTELAGPVVTGLGSSNGLSPSGSGVGSYSYSLVLNGSSLSNGASGLSLNVGNANSWTAVQTFEASGIRLLGSSTGYTTFASANSSATNYTITFPAATGTVALTSGANVATVSNSDGTLTISPTSGSVVASLALGHANTWTALQTFSAGDFAFGGYGADSITSPAKGDIWFYNGTNIVNLAIGTSGYVLTVASGVPSWAAGGGGAVSSVSNSDGTLTISPTTGSVVASIALGHANTWSAVQTFGNNISFGGATLAVSGLATGQGLYYNGTNWINKGPNLNSNGTTTTQAVAGPKMFGMTLYLTPSTTGQMFFIVNGYIEMPANASFMATLAGYYGTGSGNAPAAGAAATGSLLNGGTISAKGGSGTAGESLYFPVCYIGYINNGTPGTVYWFDLQLTLSGADSTTFVLTGVAIEVH